MRISAFNRSCERKQSYIYPSRSLKKVAISFDHDPILFSTANPADEVFGRHSHFDSDDSSNAAAPQRQSVADQCITERQPSGGCESPSRPPKSARRCTQRKNEEALMARTAAQLAYDELEAASAVTDASRTLGSLEHLFWLLDQNRSFHFAVTALISGKASPDDW